MASVSEFLLRLFEFKVTPKGQTLVGDIRCGFFGLRGNVEALPLVSAFVLVQCKADLSRSIFSDRVS